MTGYLTQKRKKRDPRSRNFRFVLHIMHAELHNTCIRRDAQCRNKQTLITIYRTKVEARRRTEIDEKSYVLETSRNLRLKAFSLRKLLQEAWKNQYRFPSSRQPKTQRGSETEGDEGVWVKRVFIGRAPFLFQPGPILWGLDGLSGSEQFEPDRLI